MLSPGIPISSQRQWQRRHTRDLLRCNLGQCEHDPGTMLGRIFGADGTAVGLDDGAHNRQAQAAAAG